MIAPIVLGITGLCMMATAIGMTGKKKPTSPSPPKKKDDEPPAPKKKDDEPPKKKDDEPKS